MKLKAFSILAVLSVAALSIAAEESKIGEIMKAVMKGDNSTYKLVVSGKGTDADAQKLYDALKDLPACKPAKGSDESWKAKTEALVAASADVVAKKPGAIDALKKAASCKACHTEHRAPKA